jgi:hypothetical protein
MIQAQSSMNLECSSSIRSFTTNKPPDKNAKAQSRDPFKTSNSDKEPPFFITVRAVADKAPLSLVYVHPLSQIVLRYLQMHFHDWVCAQNLDESLVLHRDGTFVLGCFSSSSSSQRNNIRVWTHYDSEERKHWLSVSVNQAQRRFLLQNNVMSAWRGNQRKSLAESVQDCVDDLIEAVEDELD